MVFASRVKKPGTLAVAATLLFASFIPIFSSKRVDAYGLPTEREIRLSSSANGATGVTYKVKFKIATSSSISSLVVDFCGTTPIIGDNCTAPSGFTVGGSPSVTIVSTTVLTGTWNAASANSGRTLTLTRSTGSDTPAVNDLVEFDITNVTNPSTTNASFYGRILTYPNASGADSAATYPANGQSVGNPVDAGGVALSTAAQIVVTAKVQERLLFCVYTTGSGNNCSGKSGTAVTLGDTNGVLDPAGPYVDKNAKYSITTNATGGAVVRLKGATLTSGSNTVTAIGDTATASSAGTEQFGLCNYESAGTGMTFGNATYAGGGNCSSTSQTAGTGTTGGVGTATFGYDTNGTDGTGSTYGDTLASKPAGDFSTVTLAFLGNISNTTEAGIYTSTLTFIATGTY